MVFVYFMLKEGIWKDENSIWALTCDQNSYMRGHKVKHEALMWETWANMRE